MLTTKTERLHQKQRIRNRRKKDIVYTMAKDSSCERLGKHVKTPTMCSCFMCGNPRKYYGNSKAALTVQELRALKNSEGVLDYSQMRVS